MPSRLTQRLEVRLAMTAGVGLLLFSLLAGLLTYAVAFRQEIADAGSLQRQLVGTVQIQAEVAAYAANREIARGVIEGLLSSPAIIAARIEGGGFSVDLGSRRDVDFGVGLRYPLFSPVDHLEQIGSLIVVQDDEYIAAVARRAALQQTLLMLLIVLVATVLFVVTVRIMVLDPLARLSRRMAEIRPGGAQRLRIEAGSEGNEIGMLAASANVFLEAADTAIAEADAHRAELQKLANHDPLTGLPTMRLAEDRLRMACAQARRQEQKVALLFVDLDGFKSVNDQAGHDVGDRVLCEVARRLQANLRAEDTAARIGGDEFLVILGGLADGHGAASVAANIIAALSHPIETGGHVARLGASIGIALYPDHTAEVSALRGLADQAMYRVKHAGKASFAFADALDA